MRVHGVGSTTTGLLICGESPGYYESKSGTPFVGKTGDELNRYLDGETLPARSDWFLTNLYREYHSEEGYVYTAEDLAQDEPDLLAELRRVQPRLIVPLGRHASRYFLGDIDMGSCYGIPWRGRLCLCGKPIHDSDFLPKQDKSLGAAGYGPGARVVAGMDNCGSMDGCDKPIELPTNSLLGPSRSPNLIISVKTKGVSILATSNLLQGRKTRSGGMPHVTTALGGTCSQKRTPTVAQRVHISSGRVESANESDQIAGNGCICGVEHEWRDVVILPVHHPASGLWNSEMSPYVVAGFQAVAAYLRGETEPRQLFDDPYPEAQYEEITTERGLIHSLCTLRAGDPLSIDTEGWPGRAWSVQYGFDPGTAYLLRAATPRLLEQFSQLVRRIRPKLVFHSALHDLGMSRALP